MKRMYCLIQHWPYPITFFRSASRGASPFASRPGSRDVSPLSRSPVGTANGHVAASPASAAAAAVIAAAAHGHHQAAVAAGSPRSPWSAGGSSGHQSFMEEEEMEMMETRGQASSNGEDGGGGAAEKYRVCVLGSNGTGKTALVSQFLTSEYMNTYDASLGE